MKGLAKDLSRLLSRERVKTEVEDLQAYTSDATGQISRSMPQAVALPENTREVAAILKYSNDHNIPITPRGAGSGLSGGCTPLHGGIVMDMKRMRRVIEINRGNMTARVEPGVVLGGFHHTVQKQKLFYPPDPQSQEVCTLGGNVATRAGGPRGVKYGATGNYVLGLEVALPDGSVINTGGKCVKQSSGYDLTHLMTGSEGTLGVITGITLRLLPLPVTRMTAVIVGESVDNVASIVSEIIAGGNVPAKLEFLTQGAILLMNNYIKPPLITDGQAYLLMELDGAPEQVKEEIASVKDIAVSMKAMDVRVVENEKEAESYWIARKNLHSMMMAIFKKVINEDVAVPRDKIPEFVRKAQEISASLGLFIGLGGHAGDGNIHPVIAMNELTEETEKKADEAIKRIVKTGLELGGTVSGEHGIGIHKTPFLVWEMGRRQVELMKSVKKAFDPKGIMNPGKLWNGGEAE